MTGTSEKCIACFPKIETGPAAAVLRELHRQDPDGGLDLDARTRRDADNPIDYLVHVRKVALPLFPQFGLEPNVYYIPPIHAPLPFLDQMFGPGVDQAIETYRDAPDDPDLAGLLGLFGCSEEIMPRWKRTGDTVIGLKDDGKKEIVRVPYREPVHVRAAVDLRYGVQRTNCP